MADSKFGLRSLIARDGEAIYGSLETAGAGASIQPIAPMLAARPCLIPYPRPCRARNWRMSVRN